MIYYAHPINTYNTPLEERDVANICFAFGLPVLNPNTPEHEAGYLARRAATGKGMDYFYEAVLPKCRGCVLRSFPDGMIGAGVYGEALWFHERGYIVMECVDDSFEPWSPDEERRLSVENTKALLK